MLMDLSEYSATPTKILIHNPIISGILEDMDAESASQNNFQNIPNAKKLYKQYDSLVKHIHYKGLTTVTLDSLTKQKLSLNTNPNLMFTRDSSITIPWCKNVYIQSRLKLNGRQNESSIASEALENLGLKKLMSFENDEFIEGGDVLPVYFRNKRVLIVGFGSRTTKSSILKIAHNLIPDYIDLVIGVKHDPKVLHLDTGFTILPNNYILAAKDTFKEGFLVDKSKKPVLIKPMEFATLLGYKIIEIEQSDAINNETCNILPLGNKSYVSFNIPSKLKTKLEESCNIKIHQLNGEEIDKASGGVHCLTRPIY
jgi:N-dimethylarginine dimethylaminohydrolase